MKATFAASLAAAAVFAGGAQAQDADWNAELSNGPVDFYIRYNGYFWGLHVMTARVNATISERAYVTQARFRTAGFARWVKDTRLEAEGSGERTEAGALLPAFYTHQGFDGGSDRRIEVSYSEDEAEVSAVPPMGDMGEPPATQDQRMEAFDPITTMLEISLHGGEEPCNRTVPVFDSKLRYNLRFEYVEMEDVRTAAYSGPAYHCLIYYDPIAGFDPSDLEESAEAYATPIHAWLAVMDNGLTPPVRLRATYGNIRVSVEARRVFMQPAEEEHMTALENARRRG